MKKLILLTCISLLFCGNALANFNDDWQEKWQKESDRNQQQFAREGQALYPQAGSNSDRNSRGNSNDGSSGNGASVERNF